MSDELLLPTLCVDGCFAVVWSQAVDSYLHNPILTGAGVERGRTVCPECGCAEFDSPCGGPHFTTPAADLMPWVVPGRAETDEFLGVRVKPGSEMALRGRITQEASDDYTSGVLTPGKATLTGSFQVCGITARGVRYGFNWLSKAVRWAPGCTCQPSTLTVWLWCDPVASCGRRYLRDARVVEFQISDDDALLPGCHAINVDITWEIEDPKLWLDANTLIDTHATDWTIDLSSKFCDACNPMSFCTPESQGLVAVPYQEERPLLPVDIRSDQRWCPVGSYQLGDMQQFGGDGIASPETFSVITPEPCNVCTDYGIRLVWDGVNLTTLPWYRFETVRWTNPSWTTQQMPGIGCDCAVKVVQLKYIFMDTSVNPPVKKMEIKDYTPGDDDSVSDCCFVGLNWTSPAGGTWSGISSTSSSTAPRTGWDQTDPGNLGLDVLSPPISGWPPVACTIKVWRPDCRPATETLDACNGRELPIHLWGDGTWTPIGWKHNKFNDFDEDTWPPKNVDLVIDNQFTSPVNKIAYQPSDLVLCRPGGESSGLFPPVDPQLDDDILAVDWCNTATTCAYPWIIPAAACERYAQLVVTVGAGNTGEVRWMRWGLWERRHDWGNMDTVESREQYRTAEPVAVGEVALLGAGQTVVFDGQQQRILLECASTVIESEAAAFGPSGVFSHPTLDGGREYIFAVIPYPWATPTDTWYRVDVVEWEQV